MHSLPTIEDALAYLDFARKVAGIVKAGLELGNADSFSEEKQTNIP